MSNEKFKNEFRIPSARLKGWDYGSNGLYFITICTTNREHYFGSIVETQDLASLNATEIGKVAIENWRAIPRHFPFMELDEFVVMPNHVHGILLINKPEKEDWVNNQFGVQSQNIPSVIRGYKASVKKHATLNNIDFSWQSRYYDRIIRTEGELRNVRNYIDRNPRKWEEDRNNPENLFM